MAIAKLDKNQWHTYFDVMTKELTGKQAEIEVASLDLGDQVESDWLPLLGITYDPKSDVAEIVLEGLDHLIHKPKEIYVDGDAFNLNSLDVVDNDGMHQIVRLRDPLRLPAP
jgi:Family of unknown function (DUF5335)